MNNAIKRAVQELLEEKDKSVVRVSKMLIGMSDTMQDDLVLRFSAEQMSSAIQGLMNHEKQVLSVILVAMVKDVPAKDIIKYVNKEINKIKGTNKKLADITVPFTKAVGKDKKGAKTSWSRKK